jgi:DNA-binding response OmpR family regulator
MTKALVLIIEDDPRLAAIYQKKLQQIGFDTALDMDGNQYATIVSAVHPALIILDLHMPFASGVEILRQIRSSQRLANVPVVVITADFVLAKSVEGQADEILIKPVSINRLGETVLRLCSGGNQNELQGRAND